MKIKKQDGNLKRKLHGRAMIGWIILFSFTDAFFTDMGIRNGFVEEANPFAKELYEWHWSVFYGFKVFLPILLFMVYPTAKNKKWINLGILLCFLFYLLVNLYHFAWMGLVFYTL